jgi:hypothetical protein
MTDDLKLDVETFKALSKMLKSLNEDMEVALENIKNLKVTPVYHKLFLKDLSWDKRNQYQSFFKLNYIWEDLTLGSLNMNVTNDKTSDKKHLEKIYKTLDRYNFKPNKIIQKKQKT